MRACWRPGLLGGLAGCALALAAALCLRGKRRLAADLVRRAPELPLLWICCALALLFHALHSTLAWGFPTTGAWYAMAALPALFTGMLVAQFALAVLALALTVREALAAPDAAGTLRLVRTGTPCRAAVATDAGLPERTGT